MHITLLIYLEYTFFTRLYYALWEQRAYNLYVHVRKKGMPLIFIMEGMGKKVLKENLYETKNIASDMCIYCICLDLL